jgi:hypothetical protein
LNGPPSEQVLEIVNAFRILMLVPTMNRDLVMTALGIMVMVILMSMNLVSLPQSVWTVFVRECVLALPVEVGCRRLLLPRRSPSPPGHRSHNLVMTVESIFLSMNLAVLHMDKPRRAGDLGTTSTLRATSCGARYAVATPSTAALGSLQVVRALPEGFMCHGYGACGKGDIHFRDSLF